MLLDYSAFWSSSGAFIVLCTAVCISISFSKRKQLPVPVVGVSTSPGGYGLRVLGVIANICNTRDLLERGYRKVVFRRKREQISS
jgi:hypothetical protein